MAGYSFTNKAVNDLSDIWNYTRDSWSEKQADKYYTMLLGHWCPPMGISFWFQRSAIWRSSVTSLMAPPVAERSDCWLVDFPTQGFDTVDGEMGLV